MAILRKKKIRGLRRRKQVFINWYNQNKKIDLNLLHRYGYFYAKAKVGPWANLDNEIQYPSGYRKSIFNYLLELFSNWKNQLDQLEQPYYLKSWLYNPWFLNSQVVAAIGDRIKHYELLFTKAKQQKEFPKAKFPCNLPYFNNLDWELYKDEDYIPESDFTEITLEDYKSFPDEFYKWRRFYRKLLKLNTSTRTVYTTDGEEIKVFVLKKGDLWISQNKQ